jgi:hypothetical protein
MHPTNFHQLTSLAEAHDLASQQEICAQSAESLPALIHFVWVGPNPPSATVRRMHDWAVLNPSFSVCLWRDPPLKELAESYGAPVPELLRATPNAAAVSDIGRFTILNALGGIYLDADMEACRPITPLLTYSAGFIVRESRWLIVASVVGLQRNSLFGRAAIGVIERMRQRNASINNFVTGPPLVTELSRAASLLAERSPVVLPDWTFFPYNPFRFPVHRRSSMPPYAIHLYDHSWGEGAELHFFRRSVRALLQILSPRDVALGKRRSVQLELRKLAIVEIAHVGRDGD